jgi:rhodanese-related sulfurtransferase
MTEDVQIDPKRAAELIESGAPAVDVREDDEYEAGHIAGARHVRMDLLSAESAGVEPGSQVVFYCRGGDRSATAATAFAGAEFEAYSIAGGLAAWADDGLPLEPEDGTVAERSGLPPA